MNQTKFFVYGNIVEPVVLNSDTALNSLPPKIYVAKYDKLRGFHLIIERDKFILPEKIYGNTIRRAKKCINTYKSRDKSTGILMTGNKGTGKSLLMSVIANKMVDNGVPVITIKEPFSGVEFSMFLDTIGECCLLFDEFGKVYSNKKNKIVDDVSNNQEETTQQTLLSLMDGGNKSKRMFLLSENDVHDINSFMLNRPGRIYYHFKYRKMDLDSIKEYCDDYNVKAEFMNNILELSRKIVVFSFDILQSIVEEHIRFPSESLDSIVDDLNIEMNSHTNRLKIVKITDAFGVEHKAKTTVIVKPDEHNSYVGIYYEEENDMNDINHISLTPANLKYEKNGNSVYETDEGITVITREINAKNDYSLLV